MDCPQQSAPFVMLFCRHPEPGAVKTRLALGTGAARACALYRAFVQDVLTALQEAGAEVEIHATPQRPLRDVTNWLGREVVFQKGRDLGERMANAFARAFAAGRRRALLLGTDVPHLPPAHLRQAWRELEHAACVLGPALDGGYYCIGLRREHFDAALFSGVSWSSGHVLQQTLARRPRTGRTTLLPALGDCDTLEDLQDMLRTTPPGRACHTRRQAAVLGL